MRSIEIDENVYAHIQSVAIPYEDKNPNDTLRRVFGLGAHPKITLEDLGLTKADLTKNKKKNGRARRPKTDLVQLVRNGFLEDSEVLFLVDYSGNRVAGLTAQVSGAQLIYQGEGFSMSKLAQFLLEQQGYQSSAVRGPARWENANKESVQSMWELHLASANSATAG